MGPIVLVLATLGVAWSNGANDNFKGVATLHGGGVLSYRAALAWASLATLLGGLTSVLLADRLVATFSGAAILDGGAPDATMLAAMLAGAGATVFLATIVGMPTSTTHALMGALLGVALAVDPASIRVDQLGSRFFGPMLLSPVLAIVLTTVLYAGWRWFSAHRARAAERCLCVAPARSEVVASPSGVLAFSGGSAAAALRWRTGTVAECRAEGRAHGGVLRLSAQSVANAVHGLSGGAVCFARALNDTPKIAAVLLVTGTAASLGSPGTLALVTAAAVAGGLLQSRRVARTMSEKITHLETGPGLTANLVTAGLVLGASRLGVPVSTTHVSCGSIFGVGAATRRANVGTITRILGAWVVTLPLAAALGAGFLGIVRLLGV